MQPETRNVLVEAHGLFSAGQVEQAGRLCRQVLANFPDHPNALYLMGLVHHKQGDADQALTLLSRACRIKDAPATWLSDLAELMRAAGRLPEAEPLVRRAIAGDEKLATAWNNLGLILQQRTSASTDAHLDEALGCYDKAIALDPNLTLAYFNRGTLLLSRGDFERGWRDYEWRKQSLAYKAAVKNAPTAPWLGGEPIQGKTVLVYWEQGLGDTLQFCRYLRDLNDLGARVVFSPQGTLGGLLRGLKADFELIDLKDKRVRVDFHVPLLSLPLAFRTTLDTVPGRTPYLDVDAASLGFWRRHLDGDGFKIGICWQGATGATDAGRSFAVAEFQSIARIPGVRLFSLHKGVGASQLERLPEGMQVETFAGRLDAGRDAFVDTAAVMKLCDLVITSDTATAHLAGALGVPAWVVLKHVPEWRWMLERSDSPWYPSLRLFRQSTPGDWRGVFAELEKALRTLLHEGWTMARPAETFPKTPHVAASWGEIIDKITILEIKQERIGEGPALDHVRRELALLAASASAPLAAIQALQPLKDELRTVNEALWEIEDRIRTKEAGQAFDDDFIALARSVYKKNDERSRLKRAMNQLLDSELVEEKQYSSY